MPKSLTILRLAPACLGALVLTGCFGSEPGDSPYTVHRGESIESIQLEIEPDGTPLIIAQVGMYMAHNDPHPDDPWSHQVIPQNFHSILHRRSMGAWSATAFKNIQPYQSSFPTLIPDQAGRFQALVRDGEEIKRYVFGNGGWNRAPGTEWPSWIESWGGFGGGLNWNRNPHVAVAGANLLLTLHTDWGAGFWVMEGKERRVELADSGNLDPLAFHVGDGFRSLATRSYVQQDGNIRDGVYRSFHELRYYRWLEGDDRAEMQVLDRLESVGESFFARHQGGTALYVSNSDTIRVYSLDDSGRVNGRDTVVVPEAAKTYAPLYAADMAGCLHGLSWLPDTGNYLAPSPSFRFGYWNGCEPGGIDTLIVPKPDTSRTYIGNRANLRIAPDGTPVAAVLLREVEFSNSPDQVRTGSDPTFLYLAEFRAGAWSLVKVDERGPPAGP